MTEIQLLTPKQVANMLCVTEHTLAVWRCEQRYPLTFVKVGRSVRYHRHDVNAFLSGRTRKQDQEG